MKKARVILMVLVVIVLATGTIFEKYRGADWVASHYYGSWWFAVLMALVAVGAIVSIVQGKMWHRPAALLIHASIPVILLGAALTTWTGERYTITLAPGETQDGITLERFEVLYYPGTHTPMDFVSHVTVPASGSVSADSIGGKSLLHETISMNHILRHNGRRFYQEDYDSEGRSTLAVTHDPYGIPVVYTGFALLLAGLGWLCLRQLHTARRFGRRVTLLLFLLLPLSSFAAPRTLPKPTASKMGEMFMLYQGRICPVQTFAKDFTTKLTGHASYEGLSPEQFLSGFLFYYGDWADFEPKKEKRKAEGEALIKMLLSGHTLKLFPVADSSGALNWYAQNDDLPLTVTDDEYLFIRKQLSYCQELVVGGDFDELERVFEKTRLWQEKQAAGQLPSPTRVRAERLYNALTTGHWLPILTITLALLLFALTLLSKPPKAWLATSLLLCLTLFLLLIFVLRWIAGGHIPMAGGFDTMNLMALTIGILALLLACQNRKLSTLNSLFSTPLALLAMGFCLLVAMISGSNPPVTPLMPVLNSPLLCLHVAVIMMSYALLFLLMLVSIAGLISSKVQDSGFTLGKRLLRPAVFLLALGIVIGAVWANISWGSYWSWDPKEVWALITLIVYSFPLHPSLSIHRNPRHFLLYCTLAFLSVIVTYFGVNLLLGGLHAYN
jgi:ABC-type transport system involved in cytochrome c biogenesis permease subunit